jgi:hypothetical protein
MKNEKNKHLEKINFDELEKEICFKKFNLILHKNERTNRLFYEKIDKIKYFTPHCIYEYNKYCLNSQFNSYFKELIKLVDNEIKSIGIGAFGDYEYCIEADYNGFEKKCDIKEFGPESNLYYCVGFIVDLIPCKDDFYLVQDFIFDNIYYKKHIDVFKLIFKICNELNIQLIMYTCSMDVLNGFIDALADFNENNSQAIRLDVKEGAINPVCFNFNELIIAKNNDISIF